MKKQILILSILVMISTTVHADETFEKINNTTFKVIKTEPVEEVKDVSSIVLQKKLLGERIEEMTAQRDELTRQLQEAKKQGVVVSDADTVVTATALDAVKPA